MDVYCPRCDEPWDVYHIEHELTPEEEKRFWNGMGCPCCDGKKVTPVQPEKDKRGHDRLTMGEKTGILRELLGNDIDGIAAMLDDCI